MTEALLALIAVVIVLALLLVYVLRVTHKKEREWSLERQLLISRLQHPEFFIHPREVLRSESEPEEDRPAEKDESDLVGKVMPGGGEN